MPCNSKIVSFGLMITVLLLIMLTGCDFLNHGKPDAKIAIDLSQPGKTFPQNLYGHVIENLNHLSDAKSNAETGNLKTALNIAAKMIAMENNADSVGSVSDSSVLLNLFDKKTNQDLKGENHQKSIHTPAYYALKMFSDNRPDKLMPIVVSLNDSDSKRKNISATAGIHEKSGIVIIKLVNLNTVPSHCRIVLKYKQPIKYKGEMIVMTSGNSMDGNSLKEPEKVVPMTKDVNGLRNTFNYECPANAIVIIHLRYKKGINGFVDCC
jgi:alpha-L-arabinofuranosidase